MSEFVNARAAREWREERDRLERAKPGLRLAVQNTAPPPDSEEDYGAQPPPAPIGVETAAEGEPSNLVELPVISAASFADKETSPRLWHVPEDDSRKTVTLLAGDGGVGKSLIAQQLAVATAWGSDWFGTSPRSGAGAHASAEDDLDELHRRIVAVAESYGVDLAELAALHFVPLAGRDAVMAAATGKRGNHRSDGDLARA